MATKKSARLTRRAALAAAGAGAATALLTPAQAYYNRPTVRYRPAFRYTYRYNRYGRRERVIIVDNGGN